MLKITQTESGFDVSIIASSGEELAGKVIKDGVHGWCWNNDSFETSDNISDEEFKEIDDMLGNICSVADIFDPETLMSA